MDPRNRRTSRRGLRSAQAGEDVPEWIRHLAIDPESAEAKEYAQFQKRRVDAEKELRKIRFKHFGNIRNTQIRQEGIVKMREFTDPAVFPAMIEIFEREGEDVRTAMLDHFYDAPGEAGDESLAWVGVFDKHEAIRKAAADRLMRRIEATGEPPESLKLVVFEGLRSRDKDTMASAAKLAETLKIAAAIPWLIGAQVQGAGAGSGGAAQGRAGDLAWIMVAQQVAFVSDLTPVVGPNAVAFDPQLSVVNEGTLLRIQDAAVITYHIDIHNSLIGLTEELYGQPTRQLGWNLPAWREWYRDDFKPFWAAKQAAEAAKKDGGGG